MPEGSITKKKIKEKEYYYHRITINGKRKEDYLDFDEVPELRTQIEERKALEKELKELKRFVVSEEELGQEKDEQRAYGFGFCDIWHHANA